MPKFRKRPLIIEATQWFCPKEFGYFKDGVYYNTSIGVDNLGVEHTVVECGLNTLEGFMLVKEGDWIITGIEGELYACKDSIFKATYEEVVE